MKPPCIISYATAGFHDGMRRLIDAALEHCPEMDLLMFSPDMPERDYKGVPIREESPGFIEHKEVPYYFKVCLITHVHSLGYEKIIWLDTSIRPAKNLAPLFCDRTGITVFHNLGHPLKNFISDVALQCLCMPDVENIPQIWGGAFLLNFEMKYSPALELENCSMLMNVAKFMQSLSSSGLKPAFQTNGSNRPGFVAHRHDQAIMSVLVHERCRLEPYGKIASVAHAASGEYGNDVYLIYGK